MTEHIATDAEIAEIERLAAAVTPKWTAKPYDWKNLGENRRGRSVYGFIHGREEIVCVMASQHSLGTAKGQRAESDMEFIVACRSAVPALVARIREADGRLKVLTVVEGDDGLASANRLLAACESGNGIDQHAAPDLLAARNEIVSLRERIVELEVAMRSIRDDNNVIKTELPKLREDIIGLMNERNDWKRRTEAAEAKLAQARELFNSWNEKAGSLGGREEMVDSPEEADCLVRCAAKLLAVLEGVK